MRALTGSLRLVWGNPGTRLGMWSHFTSQFAATVFALLWGFPFLVRGEGLSPRRGQHAADVMTGWIIVSGLVLGSMVSRYPFYRSLDRARDRGRDGARLGGRAGRSTPAPLWLLVVLVCLMATGGPASMVGFDLARTFIPVEASGRANGFVNIGGFSASLLTMGLIGVVLDWHSGGGAATYDLDDFRVAMSVQCAVLGVRRVQILRYRRKAIAHLRAACTPAPSESLKRGEPVAHLGFHEREGL